MSDTQRYTEGLRSFEFGDCERVVVVLDPLSKPGRVTDQERLLDVHRMLGVCYFQLKQEDRAREELKALLYLKADYVLDPFLTPPAVVDAFEQERQEVKRKLEAIQRSKEQQKPPPSRLVVRTVTVENVPFWSIFVPFGGAQFANDEPIKGGVIGGLTAGAVALNVAGFWTAQTLCWTLTVKDGGCFFPFDDGSTTTSTANTAYSVSQVVSISALAAAFVIYGYGVVDGWWNWVPQRTIDTVQTETVLDDAAGDPAETQNGQRSRRRDPAQAAGDDDPDALATPPPPKTAPSVP